MASEKHPLVLFRILRSMSAGVFTLGLCLPAPAMDVLDDQAMAEVTGRDGLFIDFQSASGATATSVTLETDRGAAPQQSCATGSGIANQHACTLFSGVTLEGVGGPLQTRTRLDVSGTTTTGTGVSGIAWRSEWDQLRLTADALTVVTGTNPGYAANSVGSLAYYSTGNLAVISEGFPFNPGYNQTRFELNTVGDIIYRQGGAGAAEISFGNFNFGGHFSDGAALGHNYGPGTLGLDATGLYAFAPFSVLDLNFDLLFKAAPTNFDITGRQPMILFGWQGGLRDALIRIGPGGLGYGIAGNFYDITNNRSDGLHIDAEWDFDTDYKWIIGQAGGNRTQIWFYDWQRVGGAGAGSAFSMPIILDVLQNGVGPAGICFGGSAIPSGRATAAHCGAIGGEFFTTRPGVGRSALAVVIHDAHNYAYNTKVRVIDPGPGLDPNNPDWFDDFDWSLLYTWGKFDADIMVYPEGPGGSSTGMRSDVTLAIQSPGAWVAANSTNPAVRATAGDNWRTNTHFALVDTGVTVGTGCTAGNPCHMGIGILNSDLVWNVRDFFLQVRADGSGTSTPAMPGGLWLGTDSAARYEFRGMLGGGNFKNLGLTDISVLALGRVNLSTDRFLFVLSPGTISGGDAPLRFDGILDLDGSAELSMAEISSPQSSFRLYNVQGRIGWGDGEILVQSGNNTVDGLPRLTISNDLLLGNTGHFGGLVPTDKQIVANVGFGAEDFGRIAIPSGHWYNEVTLKIPD